jgi:hypothetical protein
VAVDNTMQTKTTAAYSAAYARALSAPLDQLPSRTMDAPEVLWMAQPLFLAMSYTGRHLERMQSLVATHQ